MAESIPPNFGFQLTADESWIVSLEPPLVNDPDSGWHLELRAGDDFREVSIHFAGWSERDIEAWLLKAAHRLSLWRDSDRGGPTPETLRHAQQRQGGGS